MQQKETKTSIQDQEFLIRLYDFFADKEQE